MKSLNLLLYSMLYIFLISFPGRGWNKRTVTGTSFKSNGSGGATNFETVPNQTRTQKKETVPNGRRGLPHDEKNIFILGTAI